MTRRRTTKHLLTGATLCGLLMLVSCSDDEEARSLVGVWTPDDGTGEKVIEEDGDCRGMYYQAVGDPLDIGGPMSCSMSTEPDSSGVYALVVSQPPNQQTLQVTFVDDDTVEVARDGQPLLQMTR